MSKREKTLFFSMLLFSFAWHLFGHFFLYDIYTDEGEYLINAKNWSSFGVLSLEGSYNTAITPLQTFLHKIIFDIFSPSIQIARVANLFFIISTLILAYLFFRKFFDSKIVIPAFIILTVNGVFNQLTTYAAMESKAFFFIFLSFFCCFSSNKIVRRIAFLPFALALGFKYSYLYLSIPILAVLILNNKREGNDFLSKVNALEISLFIIGVFITSFPIFFIAYQLDPIKFFEWGFREAILNRVDLIAVINDPFGKGILPTFLYYLQRAPISSVLFLWGFTKALTNNNKSTIEIFLILWVAIEILFFSLMPSVRAPYLADLIFPLSILSVNNLMNKVRLERPSNINLNKFIIISIVSFQIISSSLYYLWIKPLKPSFETMQWLEENAENYETIMIPSQLAINLERRTYTTSSDSITINQILNTQDISYPVLCIVQKKASKIHQEDSDFLEFKAKLIKKIDYFWIYEIQ